MSRYEKSTRTKIHPKLNSSSAQDFLNDFCWFLTDAKRKQAEVHVNLSNCSCEGVVLVFLDYGGGGLGPLIRKIFIKSILK